MTRMFKKKSLLLLLSFGLLTANNCEMNAQEHKLENTFQTAKTSEGLSRIELVNPSCVDLVFKSGQRMTVDFYTPNIFRLFLDPNEGIVRDPEAKPEAKILVDKPRNFNENLIIIEEKGRSYTITSSKISLVFDQESGLFSVYNKADKKLLLKQIKPIEIEKGKAKIQFLEQANEYFFGGGVQNGRFSHKGTEIAIENTNSWIDGGVASPSPNYWSTAGYGLLWHTFKPGIYDFGSKDKGVVSLKHSDDYLDIFLMFSPTPTSLLNDYYQLTGRPVLLPKFGFYQGHLNAYNRDYWTEHKNGFMAYEDGKRYNESQKDNGGIKESLNGEKNNYQFSARAAIDRYVNNDMPLGWFLPNDGYGAGYGQEKTLDGNIQNLKSFGEYARSKGVEIGLWTQSDLHPKAGIEALLQRDIVKEVRDAGVRVLKTDVAWVGAGYSFGLNGVADVAQIMPYYGQDARPFIISLDGWAGTQRYASIWSGDQTGGEWEYIRFHIPTFIGSGLSGQPNITSDVDGIFGGKNLAVNVREFQWKTFTPMELNMDGWGRNPKYPTALGEPATSINRWYLKLKSELMPYAYTLAYEATFDKPMIRALFLDYPSAYTLGKATQYEFLYGANLLVAPVYRANKLDKEGNDVRHNIYLPKGKWYDYFTGECYEGGKLINDFDTPLWKLPVFVKAGAIIPITNPNNNPNEIRKDYRIIEFYPSDQGTQSEFTLYDDDGKTQAYLNKEFVKTKISYKYPNGICSFLPSFLTPWTDLAPRFVIEKTKGNYQGFEQLQATELRINLSEKPQDLKLIIGDDEQTLREVTSLEAFNKASDEENIFFYEAKPNFNRFATAGTDFAKKEIIKNPVLRVKVAKTDITKNKVVLYLKGLKTAEAEKHLLKNEGALAQLKAELKLAEPKALTITWDKLDNADYYEVLFDEMTYSTIRANEFKFEDLTPETSYDFMLRAVNKSGYSAWTKLSVKTSKDPLEFAVKGLSFTTTCANQGAQGLDKLGDRDEKSIWHTKWSDKAIPFTLIADMHSINVLDKLEYLPREDAANGTILKGQVSYSTDRKNWSKAEPFTWERNNATKTITFASQPKARYIRLDVTEAVGNFGSGRELYIFKVAGTTTILQGDINKDKRIDDNDFTSYLNYTGLRKIDNDFDYVSSGDINKNGLIDAFDISHVSTVLDGGVRIQPSDNVEGKLIFKINKTKFQANEEVEIIVSGSKEMKAVNALSFALPYDKTAFEFIGIEKKNMRNLFNLTYDRLHSNGEKALYPTFVNKGYEWTLEGDKELFVIKFRAKKSAKFPLKIEDGILVDRALNTVSF